MATNIKILLDKRRAKQDGSYPLVMRVIHERRSTNIPLGYSLQEKDWDEQQERLKPSSHFVDNTTRFNNAIQKKRTRAYDLITQLYDEKKLEVTSIQQLRVLITGEKKKRITVFSFLQQIVDDLTTAGKVGNAEVYKATLRMLKTFTSKKDLYFEQVNYVFLNKFENWHYSKGARTGSLSVYMRTLRAAYNRAIKSGIVKRDHYPFTDYKIKNGQPTRKALSESDFRKLISGNLEGRYYLQRARDLFMASFFLRGMNWMDLAYLKVKNIQGDFDRVRYVRQKTGKPFSVKISDPLKKLMLKYLPEKYDQESFIFPILDYKYSEEKFREIIGERRRKLNKQLKEISRVLNIERFTIYTARHTYATMGKRKGVPVSVIKESLGHSSESVTQVYLDSFENEVIDSYDEVIIKELSF